MKLFAESFEKVLKKVEKLAHKEAMRIHKTNILKKIEKPDWEVSISRNDWWDEKVCYTIVARNMKEFFETGHDREVRMTSEFSVKKYPVEWQESILQAYEETFEEDLLGYKMKGGLAILKSEE